MPHFTSTWEIGCISTLPRQSHKTTPRTTSAPRLGWQSPCRYIIHHLEMHFTTQRPALTSLRTDLIHGILVLVSVFIRSQNPDKRYVHLYTHFFSRRGLYALTVQVFNGVFPTAKKHHRGQCDETLPARWLLQRLLPRRHHHQWRLQTWAVDHPFSAAWRLSFSRRWKYRELVESPPRARNKAARKYKWAIYRLTPKFPTPVPSSTESSSNSFKYY